VRKNLSALHSSHIRIVLEGRKTLSDETGYAIVTGTDIVPQQKVHNWSYMVTIYADYADEPEDIFLPLPEELACELYALEMESYVADINFIEPLLPRRGAFLEMGCGTGRITRRLAEKKETDRLVIGMDISMSMLQMARQRRRPDENAVEYLCMDMVKPAFAILFDVILIPYNTLNLLGTADKISACLNGCREILRPGGTLFVQLFIPTEDFIKRKKTFQFQMFDRPGGGKIIKEIVKQYHPQSRSVHIEERFRIRPMQAGPANEDWHSIYTAAGFSADQWIDFFQKNGFIPTAMYKDYYGSRYTKSAHSSTFIATLTLL
jgi:ubiquinone/menaquinone biosynthesis C-methylase UbiE